LYNPPRSSLVSAFRSDPDNEDRLLMEAIQLSKVTFIEEAAHREVSQDIADSSRTYTLKVGSGSEMRRLTVRWLTGTSTSLIFESICRVICESFGLAEVGTRMSPLVYADDDGDECTLVASTVEDLLALSKGSVLKLRVAKCAKLTLGVVPSAVPASEEFSISTPRSLELPGAEPSTLLMWSSQPNLEMRGRTGQCLALRALLEFVYSP